MAGRESALVEEWTPGDLKGKERTILLLRHVCFVATPLETRQLVRYRDFVFVCPMAWKTCSMALEVD